MQLSANRLKWSGIVLIFITGLVHVIGAPDSFSEAAYKGWLFNANGAASFVAAIGIHYQREWGWRLGLVIAAATLIGYVASRTVGLPLIPPEPYAWFEPLGVLSFIAEALFIAVYFNRLKKE
jgi:uncharacterized membrane protein YfcA